MSPRLHARREKNKASCTKQWALSGCFLKHAKRRRLPRNSTSSATLIKPTRSLFFSCRRYQTLVSTSSCKWKLKRLRGPSILDQPCRSCQLICNRLTLTRIPVYNIGGDAPGFFLTQDTCARTPFEDCHTDVIFYVWRKYFGTAQGPVPTFTVPEYYVHGGLTFT